MTFESITEFIYACHFSGKEDNELSNIMEQWHDSQYLRNFFKRHEKDLTYFNIGNINNAIIDTKNDANIIEDKLLDASEDASLGSIFDFLDNTRYQEYYLSEKKLKRQNREKHPCWLRLYAVRVDVNYYIITGGAIKLTRTMQERNHTAKELEKIKQCRDFLRNNDIFDKDSFLDYIKTQS